LPQRSAIATAWGDAEVVRCADEVAVFRMLLPGDGLEEHRLAVDAFTVAWTGPSPAKDSASARSRRVPTMERQMVRAFSTTSKIGRGNDPGGRPLSAMVPRARGMPMAWANAGVEGAVTSTAWAPPVSFWKNAAGSCCVALTVSFAPDPPAFCGQPFPGANQRDPGLCIQSPMARS